MALSEQTLFKINGPLSTDKTVIENIETLCSAAGSWLTYDVHTGQWAVVINRVDEPIAAFDDSNIIGPVSVSGTGLTNFYNSVNVKFPHIDLNDQTDFVQIDIPAEDRNPNEPDNQLSMQFDIINDPVQAEYLGMVEIKQNRLDKVVRFVTDYSYLGINAGDLITVTNSVYDWTEKIFRIINISESDGDDGNITLNITALEYDPNVYSTDDLYRYNRSNQNGIISLGNIATPNTPTVTVSDNNTAFPSALVTCTVPDGVVSTMDFYVSIDGINFTFVESAYGNSGATLNSGDTIEFNYEKMRTGTLYAKVRATNGAAVSEFSPVGSGTIDLKLRADLLPNGIQGLQGEYNLYYQSSGLPDQYIIGGTTYNAIYGFNSLMYGFNIAEGQTTPSFVDIGTIVENAIFAPSLTGISLLTRRATAGIAIYYNWAPWDPAAYVSNGLAGLSWGSNWSCLGAFDDQYNDLGSNNRFVTSYGNGEVNPFDATRMNGEPAVVIFGLSTTLVPQVGDWTVGVEPVSGNTTRTYFVPWSQNTVLRNGSTYQFPGRTGVIVESPGAAINFKIDARFYRANI